MKLKNILIVVKDIEKSKQFYHDLFGLIRFFCRERYMESIQKENIKGFNRRGRDRDV